MLGLVAIAIRLFVKPPRHGSEQVRPHEVRPRCDVSGALYRSTFAGALNYDDVHCLEVIAEMSHAPEAVAASAALIDDAIEGRRRDLWAQRAQRHVLRFSDNRATLAFQLALYMFAEGRLDESLHWIDLALEHNQDLEPTMRAHRVNALERLKSRILQQRRHAHDGAHLAGDASERKGTGTERFAPSEASSE